MGSMLRIEEVGTVRGSAGSAPRARLIPGARLRRSGLSWFKPTKERASVVIAMKVSRLSSARRTKNAIVVVLSIDAVQAHFALGEPLAHIGLPIRHRVAGIL